MRALVVAHDPVSPVGPIGESLLEHGYVLEVHTVVDAEHFDRPGVTTSFPDFAAADLVVAMGAPWSAYDLETVGSWVLPELEQLRAADAAGVPVLGICFGGQLLAQAHGGAVRAAVVPEIGWYDVRSGDPDLVPGGPWFEWHYDTWVLPPGAREVARSAAASQAFTLGPNLAVQFHPEITVATLEGWLGRGGEAKAREAGLDPGELLSRTRRAEDTNRARAHALVAGFLDHSAAHAGSLSSERTCSRDAAARPS